MADFATALRTGLADRYRLERELGRGGMARVYLAHDLKHDRPVALKVLYPGPSALLGADRFLREIRTAARLQHPNILPVFDSGATAPSASGSELLWYSMPYVEGESLRERLRREGRLPVDDAVAIAREVAEALDYAHGRDVIHRDVKPENIMLSRGHALVADFGIARAVQDDEETGDGERLTLAGVALGTPSYMSPEQASGADRLDARSDVYSLGCVLFEMLAGEPPFTGPTPQAIIAKRFTDTVPAPSRGGRVIPGELERIVLRALAPAPAERFPTAAALAAALRDGAPWTVPRPGRQPAGPIEPSIAVLPFANLTPSPDSEFFADGMTDELINALAKLPGLHVVSRTSCFAFKGRPEDAREIGRRLQVSTVLEGSVRRAGSRLRMTTQLINVADGFLLWSESFDREVEDVFAIQDEIARAIGGALQVRLLEPRPAGAPKPPTEDLEAYGLYLKGRHFWNRRTEHDLRLGMQYFEQALARDPGFALAHAGLADSWALLGFYSVAPPGEVFPRAKRAAHDALALAPGLAEAYPALAYTAMYYDWDWTEAERAFQKAIELHPGYATARQWYGNFLSVMGRTDESILEFERGLALDPLSALKHAALGWGCYFARRYERGVEQCRRAIALEPGNMVAHAWLALGLEALGRSEEAVRRAEETVTLAGRGVSSLGFLGHAYAVAGRSSDARRVLDDLMEIGTSRYVSEYDVALIHLGLGEPDRAMEWLQRGYAERDHQMVFLKVDPRLDALRARPDFARLLTQMRF